MIKYYVRDWGRPCGVEPTIFTDKEKADVRADFGGPSIEVFNTEFEARLFISKCTKEKINVEN